MVSATTPVIISMFYKPLFLKYPFSFNRLFIPCIWLSFLGCLFLSWGCSSIKEKKSPTPGELYEKALSLKKKKNYPKALEVLTRMREQFPYSSYNPSARLLLGDIYFMEKKYTVSAEIYKKFRLIHPQTKKDYVLNQLGLCYLRQLPSSPDRDISKADTALIYFKELLNLPKKNPYRQEAEKHIAFLKDLKAKKEFITASFYIKRGWEEAALNRLNHVIQTYPESSINSKALLSAYNLAKKLKKSTESYKSKLESNFPHLLNGKNK